MKRLVKSLLIALAAAVVLVIVYGVLVEPRLILDERHYEAELPELAQQWEGTEVAVFSDLQIGMWWANTGMIERVVGEVVEEQPDVVLLGGDFLYSSDPGVEIQVDTLLGLLAPLIESDIPMFAVLGNHDYAVGAVDELTDALEDSGIEVLLNEAAALASDPAGDGPPLHIVGVGSPHAGSVDVGKALAGVPNDEPRIVLMHNPTVFPELPAHSAPLAVAGHTHCGQIALPGTPHWSYLGLTEEEAVVADGFAFESYGAGGNRLFVTCGIGFSVIPVRMLAPPQVVFFEIVAPEP